MKPIHQAVVPVPDDVRARVLALCKPHKFQPNALGKDAARRALCVSDATILTLVEPGGMIRAKTLARIVAKLDELESQTGSDPSHHLHCSGTPSADGRRSA